MVGDDVVLPCQLEPPADATTIILEWAKPDLNPRFVFVWHNGQELVVDQNKAYKGRTSLFIDKLKHGDISLKLSKVKISDEGTYRCYIPDLDKEYFVELLVVAVSSPGVSLVGTDRSSSGVTVVLQCESKGWYPQPDVFWLNSEGNLLSAGPTKTVRGPDGLYTVSSRVTVEKRQSNNFTCRVQQHNINQTRETHIIVPEDFFMAPSSCAACITTSVLFCVMFILAVAIFIWKWRHYKIEVKMHKKNKNEPEHHGLMEGEVSDFEHKLNKQLQKKEEEKNDLEKLIDKLMKQKKELVNQKKQIIVQVEKTDEMDRENEEKVKAVDKEISEKEGDKTENKALGYLKLKEIIMQVVRMFVEYTVTGRDHLGLENLMENAAFPRIVPDRLQFFEYETVSVHCEDKDESSGWRVMTKENKTTLSNSSDCHTSAPSCTIYLIFKRHSGEYWCEDEEGRKSDAVYISVTAGSVILESPARPVFEGEDVTLYCKNNRTQSKHIADFYKDGYSLGTQYMDNLIIQNVSMSDEGLYKCSISGAGESPETHDEKTTDSPHRDSPHLLTPLWIVVSALLVALLPRLVGLLLCRKDTEPDVSRADIKSLSPEERIFYSVVVYRPLTPN
ncbi:butyrophilin-like protein 1 [Scomber japonicus]|uniref:butyrophilin-like protein 1 n=1 Tax=Scomber japonicus TaxID=13676 RepID=UPI002306113C|nr:butyrophilin-like protein 1 [Scomber japonicus]